MRWIAGLVLIAACGPRAVATGPSTGTRTTFVDDVAATESGTGSGTDPGSGSGTDPGSGSGSGTDPGSGSGSGTGSGSGVVLSRLPAPHRDAARPFGPLRSVDDAHRLVGRRDPRPPLALALALAAELSGTAPIPAGSPVELVSWAQERGAWKAVTAIAPGDLLVFDRVVGAEPASLVAVALARDPRGVIEMIYLARGVLRRGFFDPARPRVVRDHDRRIVNTYLRHDGDQPPAGTRFLAGELFAGVVGSR